MATNIVTGHTFTSGELVTAAKLNSAVNSAVITDADITATGSTTARSLSARAADVVNVLDYGADKSGAADSTASIQAAIDALPSSGGEVYFPPGTYSIKTGTSYLTFSNTTYYPWNSGGIAAALKITKDNVNLCGDGPSSVLKMAEATSGSQLNFGIVFNGANDGAVTDLALNCNDTATSLDNNGIAVVGATNYTDPAKNRFTLRGCRIHDWKTDAVLTYNQDKVSVVDNSFDTGSIIADICFCTDFIFNDNRAKDFTEGLDLDKKVYNFTVDGNVLNAASGGTGDGVIELNGSRYGTVSNNVIRGDGDQTSGIYLNGKPTFGDQTFANDDTQTRYVTVSGNVIEKVERGIYIANSNSALTGDYRFDCEYVTIEGNILRDVQKTSDEGIGIQLAGRGITCNNNLVTNADVGIGLNAPGLRGYSIAHNSIREPDRGGIKIDGNTTTKAVRDGFVTNNYVWKPNSDKTSPASYYGIEGGSLQNTIFSENIVRALSGDITGATAASPIVITSSEHDLTTGDTVIISGVGGVTAANGTFTATAINKDTFSLDGTTGSGSYTADTGAFNAALYVNYGTRLEYFGTNGPNLNVMILNNQSTGLLKGWDLTTDLLSDMIFRGNTGDVADFDSGTWFAHKILYNDTTPASGIFVVGDVVWNTAPAAGGTMGWVCTTAGTVGSGAVFKTFGAIAS
jgi:hypothetical protein